MAPHAGLNFDGTTSRTDIHDSVPAQSGTATWVPKIFPVVEGSCKFIAEALILVLSYSGRVCHLRGGQTRFTTWSAQCTRGTPYANGVARHQSSVTKKTYRGFFFRTFWFWI